VYLAWREAEGTWSPEVLDFRPPQRALQVRTPLVSRVRRQTSSKPFWFAAAVAAAAIVLSTGYWYRHHFVPETRVRGLIGSLAGAPVDYDVVYGSDGRLYAFADKAIGVAWGRRASERLHRRDDVFLERTQEATRLGQRLTAAGLDYVVIRLSDPGAPEVVLGGDLIVTESVKRRVNEILGEAAPYARSIKVESIGDARLIAIARDRLRLMGISTRVDMTGARSSISNDVFLDDAALHAMSRYADEFGNYWGRRRVAINIRLWDDLLKGRSYQYSPGQLLSVGEGRWDALRAVPKGAP
ncbi:MAG TPA: PrgH/EprH family type III secretion apparatus protein, partial [Dyella sp.]|uniref:PrgH/EprH family type III secretion apparatus protein n=1 Tax=Dyella sp. TaxID=1869338 RepID=UPI002F9544B7